MTIRTGESIFPGLDADDPIKRETARLAGSSFAEGFEAIMRQGIVPTSQIATIDTYLGGGVFNWDGPYQGGEPAPVNVGGDKANAVQFNDDFNLYIAGTNTIGSDFSTTPLIESSRRLFVDYVACILFGSAAGTTMEFIYRPIGTGVYGTGVFSTAFFARDAFSRQLSPQLTFQSNEAPRGTALLTINASPGPLYTALTYARVLAIP